MKKSIAEMVRELRLFWKHYVFQSLAATLTVFILILSVSIRKNAVIIASIGATAFIVFAMPKSPLAKPRNIVGGHLVGLACGLLCILIPHPAFIHSTITYAFVYALAVGLAMFVMVVTDTEHPPAAATALGIAITGFSFQITTTIVASVVILSLVHHLLKRHLKDLL